MPIPAHGIAAFSASAPLAPWSFSRRDPGPRDVHLEILYCGICHSDLHTVRGEWGAVSYPLVPGHEIVGRVVGVGAAVTRYHVGEMVGVGCMVNSCQRCSSCSAGLEQYCENGLTDTYASIETETGLPTQGGYSSAIVVDERFVLRIPASLDAAAAAPLLCAGITTYSPLKHWAVGPATRVGVIGIGGLGHMAVKIARALGAHVVAFTTSPGKANDALRLGAHEVVVTSEAGTMRARRDSLDLIVDTVGAVHELDGEMRMLRRDGTLVLVGLSPDPHPSPRPFTFVGKRRALAGSLIGGIAETQDMLDFCGQHGIAADIELLSPDYINTAYERMLGGDVRYRFVMKMPDGRRTAPSPVTDVISLSGTP